MRGLLRTVLWLAGIASAVVFLLHLLVFDSWVVPGEDPRFAASLAPTLGPGDRILTLRKSAVRDGHLARCAVPTGGYTIGRVMASGGETIELRQERVFLNGKVLQSRHGCPPVELPHPVTGRPVKLTCQAEETGSWTYEYLVAAEHPEGDRRAVVPPGKVFLVSDNRHLHQDSRDYGVLDAAACEHVVFRLWGPDYTDASRRFTLLY